MKKIIIWGTGLEAEKFYYRYRDKYSIVGVIDSFKTGMFHEIPIYKIDEIKTKIEYDQIVIATTAYENQITRELEEKGFRYSTDYCYLNDLDKKLCIIYGNCHMAGIEEYLVKTPAFIRNYTVKRFFVHDNAEKEEMYPTDELLAACDLLISQDIRDTNKVGAYGFDKLCSRVSSECRCVKVPNLYGMNIYFPQFNEESYKYGDILREHERTSVSNPVYNYSIKGILGHRDYMIESMFDENKSTREIKNRIECDDIYSKEELEENYKSEISRLKKREAGCDIIISDFIEAEYRRKKLFYDPFHPTEDLLIEKAKRILECLNIEDTERRRNIRAFDEFEAFVYGCVYKHLGLKFDNEYIKYESTGCSIGNVMMNLEDYIEQYRLWIRR